MKKNKITKFTYLLIALLLIGNVITSVGFSSLGSVVSQNEKKVAELVAINRKLIKRQMKEKSLRLLQEKAQERGMVKPERILYLTDISAIAKVP